jgi:hypothetical protein
MIPFLPDGSNSIEAFLIYENFFQLISASRNDPNSRLRSRRKFNRLLRLALTFTANTQNSQTMMRRSEFEFCGDFVLHRFQLGRKKFRHTSACRANHVVMMFVVVVVLVVCSAITESDFPSQSGFGQKLERSIDGRLSDRGISFVY